MEKFGQIHAPFVLGIGEVTSALCTQRGQPFILSSVAVGKLGRRDILFVLGENGRMISSGLRCFTYTLFLMRCPSTSVIPCAWLMVAFTYLLTCLLTFHLITCVITCLLSYLLVYLLITFLLTCLLTYFLAYLLNYLLNFLIASLLTCLLN